MPSYVVVLPFLQIDRLYSTDDANHLDLTDCKRFMPTWKDLTEISAHLEDSSQFYMGRVDCTLQGDVCDMEGIKGYPSMHLYEDGKLVSEYTGSRKFSVLKAWISGKAQDYRRRTVAAAGQA